MIKNKWPVQVLPAEVALRTPSQEKKAKWYLRPQAFIGGAVVAAVVVIGAAVSAGGNGEGNNSSVTTESSLSCAGEKKGAVVSERTFKQEGKEFVFGPSDTDVAVAAMVNEDAGFTFDLVDTEAKMITPGVGKPAEYSFDFDGTKMTIAARPAPGPESEVITSRMC